MCPTGWPTKAWDKPLRITLHRFLLFIAFVALIAVSLQQCWQRKSDAEKWLYLFEEPARDYAGRVLGPDRGTGLAPPEALSAMLVDIDAARGYVVFASDMFAEDGVFSLRMAFSPGGPPPDPEDKPAMGWQRVRDAWYQLRPTLENQAREPDLAD